MNTIRAYRIHVPTYYLHCELGIHDSREIATRGTSFGTYTHFLERTLTYLYTSLSRMTMSMIHRYDYI